MVTQLYDDALRPLGLRATQFTLLFTLGTKGELRQADLGDALSIDSTTLTRNLALLRRRGWIRSQSGSDRRERHWRLAPAGRSLLDQARPAWSRAQGRLRRALGATHWNELQSTLDRVVHATERA
jgi:DNA-binding MarR family transcriptional regulator